ncbi:hypothetical protein ACFL6F_00370 [Planctomycetota bacterium]
MSDYTNPEESGNGVYGWLIYLSFTLFLIACIIKYLQIDSYASR